MNRQRIIVVTLALLISLLFGGSAGADLGKVDYWNVSFDENDGQKADITEKSPSGEFLRADRKLWIYGWGPTIGNPTNHAISPIGIEQNNACIIELRLEANVTMPNDKDNAIAIP